MERDGLEIFCHYFNIQEIQKKEEGVKKDESSVTRHFYHL